MFRPRHTRAPRRSASSSPTSRRVTRASPQAGDGYVHVQMDDKDGTVVSTKVTSLARDVVAFLEKVQEHLRSEVRGQEHQGLIKDSHIVGLDTEWRFVYPPGKPHRYRLAVLQLCVGKLCLVFQIHHADYIPVELKNFLANPEFCFAGVAIGNDVKRLLEDCNLMVAKTMDLPKFAADVYFPSDKISSAIQGSGYNQSARTDLLEGKALTKKDLQQTGLATLARMVMGMSVEKRKDITLSNWARRHLSTDQVQYACIDAFVSYDVARRLRLIDYANKVSIKPVTV